MSQTSGVLIVGHSLPSQNDFGAEIVRNFQDAKKHIYDRRPSVLVFGGKQTKEFESFCEWTMEHSPDSLWILSMDGLSPRQLIQWNDFGPVHDFVDDLEDPQLENKIQSAFESAGEFKQKRKLLELFEDQSQQFKRLSEELESRVDKRQSSLKKSLRTLDHTRLRLETLLKALLGIHRASSLLQMQESLTEALRQSLEIEWVRVRFENQSLLTAHTGPHILSVAVQCTHENIRAEVYFAKSEGRKFTSEEVDFLHELADALGLALSRVHALERAEMVKAQWQATFDSIPHPLCLTNDSYDILKLNRAFQMACNAQSFRGLIGKNCFTAFFGADVEVKDRTSRGYGTAIEHFEVTKQSLGLTHDEKSVQLVLLRSVTEDVRYERRILESSKMAELGVIGSSIAHELNNPLGGMLSFLQLILLDIDKNHTAYVEIKEMEQATLRCRDIILNLLSFARKQDMGEFTRVDLTQILDRAVRLVELQSKSKGIRIQFDLGGLISTKGSGNALTQVLCNLLQNSIDSISEKLKSDPLYPGAIQVQMIQKEGRIQMQITDNGTGIRPELQSQIFNPHFTTRNPDLFRGMGLTVAYTIVNEHGGTLEILSQHGSGATTLLTLPEI
jgi:signal transduction histidine kinase